MKNSIATAIWMPARASRVPAARQVEVSSNAVDTDLLGTCPFRARPDSIAFKFQALIFSALITSAFASATLDLVVSAAASFSLAVQHQLEMLQSNPSPAEFAAKTVVYAVAKTAYFRALREELPELSNISTGKEERPPELDTFAAAFAVTSEDQVKAADEATSVLLKQYSGNPVIEKARTEIERAQKVEEIFRREFDRLGFTRWAPDLSLIAARSSSFSSSLFDPSPTPHRSIGEKMLPWPHRCVIGDARRLFLVGL